MATSRTIVVAAVQTGMPTEPPGAYVKRSFDQVRRDASRPLDLLVFPELFARPFWCVGASDPEYFDWAETVDGETISEARAAARELGCHAVVPFFERGAVPGEYFNSAAVVAPDGELIPGVLPGGADVPVYRKNAISSFNWSGSVSDEKYYFREGAGFPVFHTSLGLIGVLICYDRWFPEAWRVLGLAGAQIVCVPNASPGPASDLFVPSLRTWAAQNVMYVVGANRAGTETVGDVTTNYYGLSCVLSPRGRVLAQAPAGEPAIVVAELDLTEVEDARHDLTMYRDRRPAIYGPVCAP
jgi:predicted amidohydrolase